MTDRDPKPKPLEWSEPRPEVFRLDVRYEVDDAYTWREATLDDVMKALAAANPPLAVMSAEDKQVACRQLNAAERRIAELERNIALLRERGEQLEESLAEADELCADVDRLRLDKARHMARGAVFAQLCSHLARNGQQGLAKEWLARGDAAMADVRPEDLVRIAMPPKREKETP